jgi:cytochrome c peroxidase
MPVQRRGERIAHEGEVVGYQDSDHRLQILDPGREEDAKTLCSLDESPGRPLRTKTCAERQSNRRFCGYTGAPDGSRIDPGSTDRKDRSVVRSSRRRFRRRLRAAGTLLGLSGLALLAVDGLPSAGAQGGGADLAALSSADVPPPQGVERFIRDTAAAARLGKALFWDMQAGSDGRTACASCHYSAGADNRSRNQLNPRGGGFTVNGPNAQLTAGDFPIHTADVVGSQGVLPSTFDGILDGDPFDGQTFGGTDPDFQVGGVNVRRTTGRNTPTAINAVFNFRQFWDGRAQNEFNGVNPFGDRDPGARVGQANPSGGIDKVAVRITNASLASQADGPPGNPVEMSADGRTLSDIGRKLLSVRPLAGQRVSSADSLLGSLARSSGRGLEGSYEDMVKQAFHADWWNSSSGVKAPNGRAYSLMQFNFPLFWGLAIQAYESTLVSDQSPFDQFMRGDAGALSPDAQAGMGIFQGKGQCATCHAGPLFTTATVAEVNRVGAVSPAGRDTGFANIGVRPVGNDPGQAGTDPFGKPLSISGLTGQPTGAVDGSFKIPSLRNVELTAPYFHNGGQLTLRQVVDFYARGGDFPNGEISPRSLSDADSEALVAFLTSLTDSRVRDQSAPFDHPQLFVPVGEQTRADGSVLTEDGRAVDCFKEVPATGASGGAPLARFPQFTGPPCDAAPPLERPVKGGVPGGSSGQPGPSKAAAPSPAGRPSPAVLGLSIGRRLSLRDIRRNGIRLRVTVPDATRRVRLGLYRLRGARKVRVGAHVVRIRRGGRVAIVYKDGVTRHLRTGTYRLQVTAGPGHGAYFPGAAGVRIRVVLPVRR